MFDWKETIISQYGNSTVLKNLISGIADLINPETDIELFRKNLIDVTTASGQGLRDWATIVAMNYVDGVDVVEGKIFGYDPTSHLNPFDQAPFYFDKPYVYTEVTPETGDNPKKKGWYEKVSTTEGYKYVLSTDTSVDPSKTYYERSLRKQFTDESISTLIKAKALANISNATLPVLKEFLRTILGSDQFAVDNVRSTVSGGDYIYTPVTPEEGDNPHAKGWYEQHPIAGGVEYVLTEDTEVQKWPPKTYYVRGVATMAVKFIISGTKAVTMQLFRIYAPLVVGAGVKIYWQISGSTFFGFKGSDMSAPFNQGVFDNRDPNNWSYGTL